MATLGVKVGKRNWPDFQRVVRILREYGFSFSDPKSKEWTRLTDDHYAPRLIEHLKQLGIRAYIKSTGG